MSKDETWLLTREAGKGRRCVCIEPEFCTFAIVILYLCLEG